jgi:hypothetical protein
MILAVSDALLIAAIVATPTLVAACMPVLMFYLSNKRTDAIKAAVGEVHTLVNSDKTASLQRELTALLAMRASLEEVVDMKKAARRKPKPETLDAIAVTTARIAELTVEIAERDRQAKLVDERVGVA